MNNYTNQPDATELYHYGVRGMKWGVRRGRTAQAYAKASKKLNKLDAKIDKQKAKAEKAYDKYANQASKTFFRDSGKIRKTKAKFDKQNAKYAKSIAKANNWYKAMDKTFAKTSSSLTAQQKKMGKSYVDAMSRRLEQARF